jgi:hypothetical protein
MKNNPKITVDGNTFWIGTSKLLFTTAYIKEMTGQPLLSKYHDAIYEECSQIYDYYLSNGWMVHNEHIEEVILVPNYE